jgi:hypothetical protein
LESTQPERQFFPLEVDQEFGEPQPEVIRHERYFIGPPGPINQQDD